jgi:hypothetical protein
MPAIVPPDRSEDPPPPPPPPPPLLLLLLNDSASGIEGREVEGGVMYDGGDVIEALVLGASHCQKLSSIYVHNKLVSHIASS